MTGEEIGEEQKANKCLSINPETGKHYWTCYTWHGCSSKHFNFSIPICDSCGFIDGDQLINDLIESGDMQLPIDTVSSDQMLITLIGTKGCLDLPEGKADVRKIEDQAERIKHISPPDYGWSLIVSTRKEKPHEK